MNAENLAGKTLQELREIARVLKIDVHPRHAQATLIDKIMQQPKAYIESAVKKIDAPAPSGPVYNTEEQVRQAIASYLTKPSFKASFPSDGTWIFQCAGAEDSGHMTMQLHKIKEKAYHVSRGARRPMAIQKPDGTYAGKYNDVVLTGH